MIRKAEYLLAKAKLILWTYMWTTDSLRHNGTRENLNENT